jgi:MSHA pilin protein MshA
MEPEKIMRPLTNERGFTLIEIIAVLVILGILAAVAVPKYFDMQDQARIKAARGAVAELKARANLVYAKKYMRDGSQPTTAAVMGSVGTDLGTDFTAATAAVNASVFSITISAVQGVALNPAITENWTRPTVE